MSEELQASDPPPDAGDVGGEAVGDSATQQRRLQALFLTVTGEEEVVDERESTVESRCLEEESGKGVSEYVTAVARDDGLDDTVDDRLEGE